MTIGDPIETTLDITLKSGQSADESHNIGIIGIGKQWLIVPALGGISAIISTMVFKNRSTATI